MKHSLAQLVEPGARDAVGGLAGYRRRKPSRSASVIAWIVTGSGKAGAQSETARASAPADRMPFDMNERTFAEQHEPTGDDVKLIDEINAGEGVHWLYSLLRTDRRRT